MSDSPNTTGSSGTAGSRLPVADGREIWAELKDLSKGHRWSLLLVVLVGLAGAGAGLLIPTAIGRLVDGVTDGTADTGTWAIAVAVAACSAVSVRLAARAYHTMLADLRERLVARALRLSQHRVERAGTGDLISRSSDDVAQIGDAAPQIIPALTTAVFATVMTCVGVSSVDWRYGVALLGMAPVYVLAVRWYLRTAPGVYAAERSAMSDRAQQIIESWTPRGPSSAPR